LGVPGRIRIGTWHAKGRTMFVSVRHPRPAVRIETTGLDRDAFLVSVSDPQVIVDAVSC
jgi:hypothetical protein